MRLNLYCFFRINCCIWGIVFGVAAQPPVDSTTRDGCGAPQKHYTLKIRSESEEANDLADTLSTTAPRTTLAAPSPSIESIAVEPPKIYDGAFGLMNVVAFREEDEIPSNPCVIFDYDIGTNGIISEIRIHYYNDVRLKDVMITRLNDTRWHPAKNANGDPIVFHMNKQIIQIEGRVYEEDYYKYD